jgi:hypothetical protein
MPSATSSTHAPASRSACSLAAAVPLPSWLSSPEGICCCRCPCPCPLGCRPRRGSVVAVALVLAFLVVIPGGDLLLGCPCPCPLGCRPRRGSVVAVALVLALLVVIPGGDLLLSLPLSLPSWLSSPEGICCCRCPCLCLLGCHPRRGSAVAVAFVLAFLVVIPGGDLLLPLPLSLPSWLSSPEGICCCRCLCPCLLGCHPRRGSAVAVALVLAAAVPLDRSEP